MLPEAGGEGRGSFRTCTPHHVHIHVPTTKTLAALRLRPAPNAPRLTRFAPAPPPWSPWPELHPPPTTSLVGDRLLRASLDLKVPNRRTATEQRLQGSNKILNPMHVHVHVQCAHVHVHVYVHVHVRVRVHVRVHVHVLCMWDKIRSDSPSRGRACRAACRKFQVRTSAGPAGGWARTYRTFVKRFIVKYHARKSKMYKHVLINDRLALWPSGHL